MRGFAPADLTVRKMRLRRQARGSSLDNRARPEATQRSRKTAKETRKEIFPTSAARTTARGIRIDESERTKRHIAVKLRELRDSVNMSKEEVASKSELSLALVAKMEALSGPFPSLSSIDRYVTASGGHFELVVKSGPRPDLIDE